MSYKRKVLYYLLIIITLSCFHFPKVYAASSKPLTKNEQVNKKVTEIINKVIKKGMTDFEKELALHDYLVSNTVYDYTNFLKGTVPQDSYTAYGALLKGVAVCQGYAEAMNLLLNNAGIQSEIITGEGASIAGDFNNPSVVWSGHAWNIVKIDGEYYHLDATWNDPIVSNADNTINNKTNMTHDYFNLSDAQMSSRNHRWNTKAFKKCTGGKYNYKFYMFCKNNNIPLATAERKITGSVSLPKGELAPKDLYVFVTAESQSPDSNKNSAGYKEEIRLTILKGTNSASYTVSVPIVKSGYTVRYRIYNDLDKYSEIGYYSKTGIMPDIKKATVLDLQNKITNINLEVLKGDLLNVTVSLPNGVTAPKDGAKIILAAHGIFSLVKSVIIPAGKNSVKAVLALPPSDSGYKISYTIEAGTSLGREYPTTGSYNLGDKITVGRTDLGDIIDSKKCSNITINIQKGELITGTVSLPKGEVAKTDLFVDIDAKPLSGSEETYDNHVIILKGSNSATFAVPVVNKSDNYYVFYSLGYPVGAKETVAGYVRQAYYSTKGTLVSPDETSIVQVPAKNININILKCESIVGTVSLPKGEIAETNLHVFIRAQEINNSNIYYEDWVTIYKGSNSATFVVPIVEKDGDFSVSYRFILIDSQELSKLGYEWQAYYSTTGTVLSPDDASIIHVPFNKINIEVLKTTK